MILLGKTVDKILYILSRNKLSDSNHSGNILSRHQDKYDRYKKRTEVNTFT